MKTLQILAAIAILSINAHAETLAPAKEDTQAAVLQSQLGHQVELRLTSGEKISGKVASVGDYVVHLTTLTGMEMYGMTVSLSDISAVVVRSAK